MEAFLGLHVNAIVCACVRVRVLGRGAVNGVANGVGVLLCMAVMRARRLETVESRRKKRWLNLQT